MPREHTNIDVRQSREFREERSGEDRGNRDRERGRGALVNYYDDLGFSTTQEAYEGWKTNEAQYNEQKAKAKSQLEAASSQLASEEAKYKEYMQQIDKELDKLGSTSDLVKKAYNDWAKTFVTIRVVDASGKNVEASYRVPPEVMNELAKDYAKNGITTAFFPEEKALNVSVKAGGRTIGKELHQGLRTVTDQVQAQFYKENTPKIEQQRVKARNDLIAANKNISTALSQIEAKKAEISAANLTIKETDKLRQEAIDNLRTRFEERAAAIREYFTGAGS